MRSGGCTIQQSLSSDASSILKHSVHLARRRGHPQVTPLHVASTLLSSSSSLLRLASLRSHPPSFPSLSLHSRALDLCFNVSLNRLPSSPSSSPLPSLSNSLIAALKRAQAHQRRSSIDSQPLLPLKIHLHQLLISILDDPTVTRVMREAGFSSTTVKLNLQHNTDHQDLTLLFNVLLTRNALVVGDSLPLAQPVIDQLFSRLETGDVADHFRGAKVIKLQLSYVSVRLMSRADVDMMISDLRRRVFAACLDKGVVVYAGDLRWAVGEEDRDDGEALIGFRPLDYFILEVGRLLSELKSGGVNGGERGRSLWVLASCSYKTYMRCKLVNPSIESQWDLQAVLVPSGGLALSLHAPNRLVVLLAYPYVLVF